ncbi:MAG: RagB/SusD family nutrient uptake outer membrane protein [Capnocytophaga sp.]|nr:RagB/SusD family nutrient uptake outer membrane protein [Capnocytophaga sp.]
MKKFKNIYGFALAVLLAGCSLDLDTVPKDALSPSTFWKTQKDVELALTGCYRGFESSSSIMYRDCASDDAYNNFPWEGFKNIANGTLTAADPGSGYYSYAIINRCNEFLDGIEGTTFLSNDAKEAYKAQARFLRAYRFFLMNISYGDVPLTLKNFATPEEAKVPRDPSATVSEFIKTELEAIIPLLPASYDTKDYGKITKGAAQALLMRYYLYKGDNANALSVAKSISGYSLFPSYSGLFNPENEKNSEVILSVQQTQDLYRVDFTPFLPNGSGGWSSVVPTQDFVDAYEMADGTTIAEAQAAGTYDPANPYKNRDPRLRATVIYPGQLWQGKPFASIVDGDNNYHNKADNATKTGYNYRKYLNHYDANPGAAYWNSGADVFIFRYAEVLLTIAEASNEVSGPSAEVYAALDQIRNRAGMPSVDQAKYNTKETLRNLIRNERRVELAMEGLRRWDIIRWKTAPDVLNTTLMGTRRGTVLTTTQANGDFDVNLNLPANEIEVRTFDAGKNYLLPIPQSAIDKNKNLNPNNPGY